MSDKISAVENRLLPFTNPMAMFHPDVADTADFQSLADRMAEYKVPGVSVAVINDHQLEWAKGYGVARIDSGQAVATDTIFQAASTSKVVAATIVLHLVEKGTLDLDRDVNDYLQSWQVPENSFTKEHKVTLRLLMTHRVGLPATNFSWDDEAGDPTLVQVLDGAPPAMNEPAVVTYTPGSDWQYSNLGYVVIQQLLQDRLGKPYSQIARELVFEPLGMRDSTFDYPLAREGQSREAMPHDAEGTVCDPVMPPTAVAHGGLMTTPSDLATFAIALMQATKGRPNPLLSQATARRMFQWEMDLDPQIFGVPLGAGLGVMLYRADDAFIFAHPGENFPGMHCWLIGNPDAGKGTAVMTNGAMGQLLCMEVITAVSREYGWL